MPSYKSEIKKIAWAVLRACTQKHQHMHKINRRFALTYEAPNPPFQRMLQATVCDPRSIRHSRKMTERRKLCFRIQMWTRTKRFCSKAPRTPAFRSPSTPTGVWRQAILQQWKAAARSFQRAAALCRSAGQKSLWHRLWCPNKQPHHLFCHHNHGNENPTLPAVNCDARIMLWLTLRLRKQWHVTTLRLFRCFLFRLLVLLLSA